MEACQSKANEKEHHMHTVSKGKISVKGKKKKKMEFQLITMEKKWENVFVCGLSRF